MSQAHILIVDDEPDIRELIRDILEDEGYRVTMARDGEAARAAWSAEKPDLVLLDIWMPDVDGISLLKEWAGDGTPACPVVMISGHGTVETAVEATRLGASDFIQKPLSLAKLLATVSKTLEAQNTSTTVTVRAQPSTGRPPQFNRAGYR
jgi:DNA-binding NtrC family response regulator